MNLALLVLVVLLVLLAIGGHGRYGYRAWSPFVVVVVILVILFLTGHLSIAEGAELGTGEGTGIGVGDEATPVLTWSSAIPAWWVTLGAIVLTLTQIAKAAIKAKRPAWWGKNVPRIIAGILAVTGALTVIPLPGVWWVEGVQGLLVGIAAVLGYDLLAFLDSGLRRIGPALLVCLLGAGLVQCATPLGGAPITYDGIAGEFRIDTTAGADPSGYFVSGSVRNYATFWGVPVEHELAAFRGVIASCLRVGSFPPVCIKRQTSGDVVIGGAGP